MASNDILYMMGLTELKGVGDVLAHHLLTYFDSAENVFKAKQATLEKVPRIGVYIAEQIVNSMTVSLKRAEKELDYIEKNKISVFAITDESYPKRLKECQDSPVVFYYKGKANLDAAKIVSVVGTRNVTEYGRKLTETFVRELAEIFPDILIVSGLAYGSDICAHRNALKNNLPTVGVLAHGLDRIYPSVHRNVAVEMLNNGGLLTDFMSGTTPDRENFLSRNRLIAGLADATIVVESANKGGSLVTADIAFSYGRDVFAFPGRATDEFSSGCNRMIQMNKAGLIGSARDFVMSMCWDADVKMSPRQTTLIFPPRPDNPIIRLLEKKGEFQINLLAEEMNIPIHKLTSILFSLELEGHIKVLPGGVYKLA
ncbi:MAG: DNA-processing protein DprA [Tannerella sp.]|jgi:DNA processing protein|nr:DNA-processing protein DprA [Tannerella sp.]